jgi:hypothetical protein
MPESKADRVHELIVAGFKELGKDEPERITRNVLFRDLFFVGQRFVSGNIQAVLLADEDEVRFHDGHPIEDGQPGRAAKDEEGGVRSYRSSSKISAACRTIGVQTVV